MRALPHLVFMSRWLQVPLYLGLMLIMVIIGGYETFVSRLGLDGHPDEPEWLDHVNAGVLKVKLSMALISISSIHLLKTFISPDQNTTHTHPKHFEGPAALHAVGGTRISTPMKAQD
ncbi:MULTISPECIES: YqhA family protein [unclassified Paraburkholderia]|uniref:YqhA family protein n=1 Tax=unclassified Paraburkholderia TaxID=2615204 RepID=UPI001610FFBE|nr:MULTISPECIES: YqhA family protein [unclassified Paraburkholderia]MBB5410571.1 putative membrane protein YqhA [Paraburkholderia sp. HC6.4b]MBB5452627.1 putative membrane protein YqhA [Paraburkholderia sp. Kb1A]